MNSQKQKTTSVSSNECPAKLKAKSNISNVSGFGLGSSGSVGSKGWLRIDHDPDPLSSGLVFYTEKVESLTILMGTAPVGAASPTCRVRPVCPANTCACSYPLLVEMNPCITGAIRPEACEYMVLRIPHREWRTGYVNKPDARLSTPPVSASCPPDFRRAEQRERSRAVGGAHEQDRGDGLPRRYVASLPTRIFLV